MKTKKIISRTIFILCVLLLLYSIIGWKILIVLRIETIKLPKGCETVYPTKIQISDVYWLHVAGEKVIKCDMGYEEAKAYIEAHNSKEALKYISIYAYAGMSDIAVYDSECDKAFWQQPDRDNYIKIRYFKKL